MADRHGCLECMGVAMPTVFISSTSVDLKPFREQAFKAWIDARGLRRTFATLAELKLEVARALTHWLGQQGGTATPTPITGPPSIPPAYLAWLRRTYSGVDLLGQDTQQGQAVTLSQVYCPAVTTPAAPPAKARQPQDQEQPPPTLLLERIDAGSLYCPAPPGAGKSTFCRWAVLQSIPGTPAAQAVPPPEGFAEPTPANLRTRLPLLVPLREFWEAMDCGQGRRHWCRDELTQTLATWVDGRLRPDGLDGALLQAHLAAGSAFLLLDGLDEVPISQVRDGVSVYPRALLLAGLADALPHWEQAGNRILLSSRPYGLDAGGLARLGLPRAPLEPLPDSSSKFES
ncbi:hypothetical protein [uncultured Thiodictyon sp.]|uniref:hypothetical protein n=1 Tax=uncultured Thiodictyon sp. TaxID=1846217 RepID=UPI0025CDB4F1|nr:hypothetical protein [uncultured Thiodictyon sp.]